MAVFDVREDVKDEITEIVFTEMYVDDIPTGYKLTRSHSSGIAIRDKLDCPILVQSAQDAQSLIKALNKAIELGWLK